MSGVETRMETLADFLLRCIAADEALARAAQTEWLSWSWPPPYSKLGFATGDLAQAFKPAHVLAVCAAHRRIVALHQIDREDCRWEEGADLCGTCSVGGEGVREAMDADLPCPTLRSLALAYAVREGWREEWNAETPPQPEG